MRSGRLAGDAFVQAGKSEASVGRTTFMSLPKGSM